MKKVAWRFDPSRPRKKVKRFGVRQVRTLCVEIPRWERDLIFAMKSRRMEVPAIIHTLLETRGPIGEGETA